MNYLQPLDFKIALQQLYDGEVDGADLCVPCSRAVNRDGGFAEIGCSAWMNDGFPDCEASQKPALYCALCRNIIRARARAERSGRASEIEPKLHKGLHDDSFTSRSFRAMMLASEDDGGESSFFSSSCEELSDDFEPQAEKLVRVINRTKIDVNLLRSWLDCCDRDHGPHCRNPYSILSIPTGPIGLRLIDVQNLCIVQTSFADRYIALSYVWGQAQQFMLTQANRHSLAAQGALLTAPIPQTIRDAMTLVAALNERYIWVDALCIVQDDIDGKQEQIDYMTSIYSKAYVTIVAVDGAGASAGLPGVPPTLRNRRSFPIAPGLCVVPERVELDGALEDSVYNTRAWTFQERILSRRCLFVLSQQVFSQCASTVCSEDRYGPPFDDTDDLSVIHIEKNPLVKAKRQADHPDRRDGKNEFGHYTTFVSEYSRKHMGYLTDVINAFTGIAGALTQLYGWIFHSGLPEAVFDLALLWTPVKSVTLRDTRSKELFPTWSWAGWVGAVDYNDVVNSPPQMPLHTVFKSHVKRYTILKQKTSHSFLSKCDKAEFGYFGSDDETIPAACTVGATPDGMADILSFECLTVPAGAMGLSPVPRYIQNTSCGTFVTPYTCFLFDAQNRRCGILYGLSHADVSSILACAHDLEFVLLSSFKRANSLTIHGVMIQFDRGDGTGYTIDERLFDPAFADTEWCTVNVLLVEIVAGYGRRIAVGQMHRDVWNAGQKRVIHVA